MTALLVVLISIVAMFAWSTCCLTMFSGIWVVVGGIGGLMAYAWVTTGLVKVATELLNVVTV